MEFLDERTVDLVKTSTLAHGVRQRQPLARLREAADAVDHSAYHDRDGREIDTSRQFVCPSATPLYYTPIYNDLTDQQRLRYNQLCGLSFNELVTLFESQFAQRVLAAVRNDAERAGDEPLLDCVQQFIEEEEHHAQAWQRLCKLSDPVRYADTTYAITRPSPFGLRLMCFIAARPQRFPAILWVMLALEEKALNVARRCLHMPRHELEPTYREMYTQHAHDEARHVQLDWHFIERYYDRLTPSRRRRTAWLVAKLLGQIFLRPARAAIRVVECWLREFPELQSRKREIESQLAALVESKDYHEMMYSRRTTPILFSLFDRYPEMRRMEHVLLCYEANTTEDGEGFLNRRPR